MSKTMETKHIMAQSKQLCDILKRNKKNYIDKELKGRIKSYFANLISMVGDTLSRDSMFFQNCFEFLKVTIIKRSHANSLLRIIIDLNKTMFECSHLPSWFAELFLKASHQCVVLATNTSYIESYISGLLENFRNAISFDYQYVIIKYVLDLITKKNMLTERRCQSITALIVSNFADNIDVQSMLIALLTNKQKIGIEEFLNLYNNTRNPKIINSFLISCIFLFHTKLCNAWNNEQSIWVHVNIKQSSMTLQTTKAALLGKKYSPYDSDCNTIETVIIKDDSISCIQPTFYRKTCDRRIVVLYILFDLINGVQVSYSASKDIAKKIKRITFIMRKEPYLKEFGPQLKLLYSPRLSEFYYDTVTNNNDSTSSSSDSELSDKSSNAIAISQVMEPEVPKLKNKYTKNCIRKHSKQREPSPSAANQTRAQNKPTQSSHAEPQFNQKHLGYSSKEMNKRFDSSKAPLRKQDKNNPISSLETNWKQTGQHTQDIIDSSQDVTILNNKLMPKRNPKIYKRNQSNQDQSSIETEDSSLLSESDYSIKSTKKCQVLSQDTFKRTKRLALSGSTIPLSQSSYDDSAVDESPSAAKRARTIQSENYDLLANTSFSPKSCSLFSNSLVSSVISDKEKNKNNESDNSSCKSYLKTKESVATRIKERWRSESLEREKESRKLSILSSQVSDFSSSNNNDQIISGSGQMAQSSNTNIIKPRANVTHTSRNDRQPSQKSETIDDSLSSDIDSSQLSSTKKGLDKRPRKVYANKSKSTPESNKRSTTGDSNISNKIVTLSTAENTSNNTEASQDKNNLTIQTENRPCTPRSNIVFITRPLSAVKNKTSQQVQSTIKSKVPPVLNQQLKMPKLQAISTSSPISILKNKTPLKMPSLRRISIDNSSDMKTSRVSTQPPNVVYSQSTLSSQESQVFPPCVQLPRIKVRKSSILMTPIHDSPSTSGVTPIILLDRNSSHNSGAQMNTIQFNTPVSQRSNNSSSSKLINYLKLRKIDPVRHSIDNAQLCQVNQISTVRKQPSQERQVAVPVSKNKTTQHSDVLTTATENIQHNHRSLGTKVPLEHLGYTSSINSQSSTQPLKPIIKPIPIRRPSCSNIIQLPTNNVNLPNFGYTIQNSEHFSCKTPDVDKIKIENVFSYADSEPSRDTFKTTPKQHKSSIVTPKTTPKRRQSTREYVQTPKITQKRRQSAKDTIASDLQTPKITPKRRQSAKDSIASDLQTPKRTPRRRYSTRTSSVGQDTPYRPAAKIPASSSIDRIVTRQIQKLFQKEMFGGDFEGAFSLLTTDTLDDILKNKNKLRNTPKQKIGKTQSTTENDDSFIWQITSPPMSTTSSNFKHTFTRVKSGSEFLDSSLDTSNVEQTEQQDKENQSTILETKNIPDQPSTTDKPQILAELSQNTPTTPEPINKKLRRLSTPISIDQIQSQSSEDKRFSIVLNGCNSQEDSVNTTIVKDSETLQNDAVEILQDTFDRLLQSQDEPPQKSTYCFTPSSSSTEANVSLATETPPSQAEQYVCSSGPLFDRKSEALLQQLLESLNAHPKSRKLDLACYLCKQFIEEYKINGHNREVAEHVRQLARDIIDNVRLFQ